MKTYLGSRTFDDVVVTVDGEPLGTHEHVLACSRNGFEWGFEGAEPKQLAIALLSDALGPELARDQADDFMRAVVANFGNEWEMNEEQVRTASRALRKRSP